MSDQPAKPARRWKRWIFLAVVVGVVGGVVVLSLEESSIQRAKRLQLDMTVAEVDAVMGASRKYLNSPGAPTGYMTIYASDLEVKWFFFKARLAEFCEWIGMTPPDNGTWPVTVGFDSSGRVKQITRGNELLTR